MALVLGLAACSDSGHVVTNAPTSNERAWVAGHLPGGFEIDKDYCPGHPVWTRVSGQLFAFGLVDADISRLRITASEGSSFDPFTVETVAAPTGPAVRFYVAVLPRTGSRQGEMLGADFRSTAIGLAHDRQLIALDVGSVGCAPTSSCSWSKRATNSTKRSLVPSLTMPAWSGYRSLSPRRIRLPTSRPRP